jgi:hypothetical protein
MREKRAQPVLHADLPDWMQNTSKLAERERSCVRGDARQVHATRRRHLSPRLSPAATRVASTCRSPPPRASGACVRVSALVQTGGDLEAAEQDLREARLQELVEVVGGAACVATPAPVMLRSVSSWLSALRHAAFAMRQLARHS